LFQVFVQRFFSGFRFLFQGFCSGKRIPGGLTQTRLVWGVTGDFFAFAPDKLLRPFFGQGFWSSPEHPLL
jgi:hypothetical protein